MLRLRAAARRGVLSPRRSRSLSTLPVIDVSPLWSVGSTLAQRRAVGAALHAACRDVGFFNVVSHGVPEAVTRGVLSAARSWFEATPDAQKRQLALSRATGFRGYAPLGANVTQGRPDLHEGLDFYAERATGGPLDAPNPWPRSDGGAQPQLAAASRAWVDAGLRLGAALMRGIALGLDLPERTFDAADMAGDSYWVLRLIHYPPLPPGGSATASCGEHTDYGLLTLVAQETHVAALQVRTAAGAWVTPPPLPGALVCNIGDMLRVWTNGLYAPTLHRVAVHGGSSRVSAPFFYEPAYGARVTPLQCFGPPRLQPVVYGEHLLRKVSTNFGRQLVVVPMAFDSQGGLHPNWRIMYEHFAARWASFGEDRNEAAQGMLVAGWTARASVATQRAQSRLVSCMRKQATSAYLERDVPNEWRMPDLDDLDARPVRNR